MENKLYTDYEITKWPFQAIDLIATYEEFFNVPETQRVTVYFGDYGDHFFKSPSHGATSERISNVFNKSLDAIGMTADEFFSKKDSFIYRSDIKKLIEEITNESLENKIVAAKNLTQNVKDIAPVDSKVIDNEVR